MLDTTISVKTDQFDGPLGLLLLLIKKEEMNVRDLDLTNITKQYLEYLDQMKELNFDVAGEYLYLAATLLHLKSTSAVSEEEAIRLQNETGELNITSESELVRRLEELAHFQKMGAKLWELPRKGEDIFVKPKVNRKAIVDSILTPVDLEELTGAMMDFIRRDRRKYTVLKRDKLSIKEKLVFLKTHLKQDEKTDMDFLLEADGDKEDTDNVVITFISLLEMARMKVVEIFQNEAMGKVYVTAVKDLSTFDIESANGFEEEGEQEAAENDKDIADMISKNGEEINEASRLDMTDEVPPVPTDLIQ